MVLQYLIKITQVLRMQEADRYRDYEVNKVLIGTKLDLADERKVDYAVAKVTNHSFLNIY